MKSLAYIFVFCLIALQHTLAQEKDSATHELPLFNLAQYDSLLTQTITAFHNRDSHSKKLLDSCYQLNPYDTMVNALLRETLVMQLNAQRKPTQNLLDINEWENTYPFVVEDPRIQRVRIQDAVQLGMIAFDNEKISLAANYCQIIIKELDRAKDNSELKNIANVNSLIYNTALKLFYNKKYKSAYNLFRKGAEYYPKDENMILMRKVSKEKSTT